MIAIEQQSNNQRGDESNTFEESDFFFACLQASAPSCRGAHHHNHPPWKTDYEGTMHRLTEQSFVMWAWLNSPWAMWFRF
jgi:hypothetical protein